MLGTYANRRTRIGLWLIAFVCAGICGDLSALAQPTPFTTDVIKTDVLKVAPPVLVQPPTQPVTGLASPWAALAPRIAQPRGPSDAVPVRHIALRGDGRRAEIVLTLSHRTPVSAFALDGPHRVIVDGAGFSFDGVIEALPRTRTLLGASRFGALTETTGRLLFDATGPVQVVSIAGKPTGDAVEVTIVVTPAARGQRAEAAMPLLWGTAGAPIVTGSIGGPEPMRSRLPVVLIDPGHGGVDPGAVTDQGVFEKDVVLSVSLRLKALLEARGRVQPLMTRQGDETVRLDDRVAAARTHKAALFLSLHADTYAGFGGAAVRGGSVYVLGAEASNAAARALAEKENTADARAGIAGTDGPDHAVDGILADLTMRETSALSHHLQAGLVQNLRRSMLLAREPNRAAAFRVLKQAETPAVLIELGYMSNGQDVALLQSADWQTAVAARIADAIDAFVVKPRGLAQER